jgi:hypothetical protein
MTRMNKLRKVGGWWREGGRVVARRWESGGAKVGACFFKLQFHLCQDKENERCGVCREEVRVHSPVQTPEA